MNGRRRIRRLTPTEAMYGAVLCLAGAVYLVVASILAAVRVR